MGDRLLRQTPLCPTRASAAEPLSRGEKLRWSADIQQATYTRVLPAFILEPIDYNHAFT